MSNYQTRAPDEGRDGEVMPKGITTRALGIEGEIVLRFGTVFRLPDVAKRLGISLRQLQAHIDDGSLVAVNVGRGDERRDLRILEGDLDGFLRRRKTDAVTAVAFARPKTGARAVATCGSEPSYEERRAARLMKQGGR